MSMLAGPKRKQKWTLNPRGKHWSEDSNKFGQKMLEKMGWSNGKGLGAKEQGMVEHIRVRVKNDQVGIGYTKDRDDQWTEHQDDFNDFLQNLQKKQAVDSAEITGENDKVLSGKSLEEKSKQSQKRVHYRKFTRGKDVNKYSTKDLANIFGKKDLNEKPVEEEVELDEKMYDPIGAKDMTAGVLTIKGGDMNDYFKKKFHTVVEQNNTSQDVENSENETEKYTGFGFPVKSKSRFYVNDNDDPNEENSNSETEKYTGFGFSKSIQTKSKNKKLNNLDYVFDNPCLDLNILDIDSPVSKKGKVESAIEKNTEKTTPRKRKSEFIYDNQGLDLECPDRPTPKKTKWEFKNENQGLELQCKNMVSENFSKSKLENSEFVYENRGLDLDSVDELNSVSPDKPMQKKSKKYKENKLMSSGIENPVLDVDFSDRFTSKKVKKCKRSTIEIENPTLNVEYSNTPSKKLKKIKDLEIILNGIDNAALDLDVLDKSTPKKKRKSKETEVLSNGIHNAVLDLEYSDKLTPKKTKKTTENKVLSNGLENPALDLDHSMNEICTTDFEVLRTSCGVENSALDLSDENTSKKRVTFNDEVEFNTDTVKKKKKKKKLDKYEVLNEKSKQNKLIEPVTFVNEALDIEVISEEEIDNEVNERKSKKCKRKKQRRISLLETIDEAPEEEISEATINVKAKNKSDVKFIGEFSCDEILEIKSKNSLKEKCNRKKNREKDNNIIESLEITLMEEKINKEEETAMFEQPIKVKKKKKKNLIESTESAQIDNCSNDLEKENVGNEEEEIEFNTYRKEKKKKKPSDKELVSLGEFLSEEPSQNKKPKNEKKNAESKICSLENQEFQEITNENSFQKFKKSKQVMKSLFIKNPTLMFNGSNINEIEGYGSHVNSNY